MTEHEKAMEAARRILRFRDDPAKGYTIGDAEIVARALLAAPPKVVDDMIENLRRVARRRVTRWAVLQKDGCDWGFYNARATAESWAKDRGGFVVELSGEYEEQP